MFRLRTCPIMRTMLGGAGTFRELAANKGPERTEGEICPNLEVTGSEVGSVTTRAGSCGERRTERFAPDI